MIYIKKIIFIALNCIAFVVSLIFIAVLMIIIPNVSSNSDIFYINSFKNNKTFFEEAVLLNENNNPRFTEIKDILSENSRVDYICKQNDNFTFYLRNASGYPSTESEFRTIIYSPNDEMTRENVYVKKIAKNCFFQKYPNKIINLNVKIVIGFILLFILFTWTFSVYRLIAFYRKSKNKYEI